MRYQRNESFEPTAVEDDLFLIEPASETVIYLDAVGHGLWRLLAEPCDVEGILAIFSAAFPEAAPSRLRADIMFALDALMTRGLVRALV